jgi:ankyrin repeat protein
VNDIERLFEAVALNDAAAAAHLVGADPELVNAVHGKGMTPLHEAARLGQTRVVAALLDAGGDIEARDLEHAGTPLGWAVFYGHAETARVLLERGAEPSPKDRYGNTPLYYTHGGEQGELAGWGPTAGAADYHECVVVLNRFRAV